VKRKGGTTLRELPTSLWDSERDPWGVETSLVVGRGKRGRGGEV